MIEFNKLDQLPLLQNKTTNLNIIYDLFGFTVTIYKNNLLVSKNKNINYIMINNNKKDILHKSLIHKYGLIWINDLNQIILTTLKDIHYTYN